MSTAVPPELELLTVVSVEPDSSKTSIRYTQETFSLRIVVKVASSVSPTSGGSVVAVAEVLTNLIDADNPNGDWVTRPMFPEQGQALVGSRSWRRPDAEEAAPKDLLITFYIVFQPTTFGKFDFKPRARLSSASILDPLANRYFKNDDQAVIKLKFCPVEADSTSWTSGPIAIEIHPGVFVGNFMAACNAQKMGFQAILNVAEELDVPINTWEAPLPAYKKIGLVDGTANVISVENLRSCIRWLELHDSAKTLIHCRAGCGRSGSIAIAFKCKKHPLLSYEEVCNLVWKAKSDITPHKGLKHTLESIKWD